MSGHLGVSGQRTILLLENDENDVFVFRRALHALDFKGQVRVVASLREARDYMLGVGPYSDRRYFPLPDIVVADFGLGGERGSDFVRWLREQPDYAAIPAVFFSGSLQNNQAPELMREFNIPVLVKGVDFHEIVGTVQSIVGLIQPPPGPPPAVE